MILQVNDATESIDHPALARRGVLRYAVQKFRQVLDLERTG